MGFSWKWSIKSTAVFLLLLEFPNLSASIRVIYHKHTSDQRFVKLFFFPSNTNASVGWMCVYARMREHLSVSTLKIMLANFLRSHSHKLAHWLCKYMQIFEIDKKKHHCSHNNYTAHRQCHEVERGSVVCVYVCVHLSVWDDRCVHLDLSFSRKYVTKKKNVK